MKKQRIIDTAKPGGHKKAERLLNYGWKAIRSDGWLVIMEKEVKAGTGRIA